MPSPDPNVREYLVTARKTHPCDGWPTRCDKGGIHRGDEYVRHVAFPGADHRDGTGGPDVFLECLSCRARRLNVPRVVVPLPPRRKVRRAVSQP